jgi:hypothetical protein
MSLSKKLDIFQRILGLLILTNLTFFLIGFLIHLQNNIAILAKDPLFSLIILGMAVFCFILGWENILHKRKVIGIVFVCFFDFLFICGTYLMHGTVLALPIKIGFYLSFGVFILSFLLLYFSLYEANLQASSKFTKFLIQNRELQLLRNSRKISFILACLVFFFLSLVHLWVEYLWQFKMSNLEIYGTGLSFFTLLTTIRFADGQVTKDSMKIFHTYNFMYVIYGYGLFIVLLFCMINLPLKLAIWPIVVGALLCSFSIVALLNMLINIIHANVLNQAYDYEPPYDHDLLINKIKKQIIIGIPIASFIAYELATNLQPSINYLFLK